MSFVSDSDWRKWGEIDPYFGVVSFEEFKAERIAGNRERFFASGRREIETAIREIFAHYGDVAHGRALDFGSGVGRLAIPLAERYDAVVGVDISEAMIAEARENCRDAGVANAEFVLSDDGLTRLDGSFDLVHSYIVLQHIPVERGLALTAQMLARLAPGGVDLVRRALVLVADHELNPSTFAARVAASTGAPLAASALAGCATLTGPLHGEASARALAYLRDAMARGPEAALASLAARGEQVPAVDHALYPAGDPRAAALLRWMKPGPDLRRAIRAAEAASGEAANVDMALAALTAHLALPDEAPFLIFASGRMAGWIAHAIEQRLSGRLIRPRANYVGG